jgi:chemotaxis signal transduction protein
MSSKTSNNESDLVGFLSSLGAQAANDREEEKKVEVIQVIGLELSGEHFIVDILNVREIVRLEELEITRVPHAHYYVLGVINLRGKVVPVVDLGLRMHMKSHQRDTRARLVVVEIDEKVVGFTVDAGRATYAAGVAMVNDQIMTLLELSELFAETAMAIQQAGEDQ